MDSEETLLAVQALDRQHRALKQWSSREVPSQVRPLCATSHAEGSGSTDTLSGRHKTALGIAQLLPGFAEGQDFRPVVGRGVVDDPEAVFSVGRLIDLLSYRSLEYPQLRCYGDKGDVHPDSVFDEANRPSPTGISRILRDGATLVLDAVHHLDPVVEVASRSAQWLLGAPVVANAYLTSGSSDGFGLHWDDHDVVILHISGRKSWEVRGPSRVAPLYRDVEPNREPSEEVVWKGDLSPGDLLYIPRGYWHAAGRSAAGHSLHLTLGISRRTGVDWLQWLADQGAREEALREDLNADASLENLAVDLVRRHSVQDFRREADLPATQARVFNFPGSETSRGALCVAPYRPHVQLNEDGSAVVRGPNDTLTFGAKAATRLDRFLSGLPTTSMDPVDEEIATTLVDYGVCTWMTDGLHLAFSERTLT